MNAAGIAGIITGSVALIGAITGLITALRKPSESRVHDIAAAHVNEALSSTPPKA